MAEARVKGLAFRTVMRTVEQLYGERAGRAVLGRLSSELHDGLYYGKLVASGWFPIAWYRELLQAIVATQSQSAPRQIGRAAIVTDLNGVHKAILALLNPKTVLTQTPRLFGKYYDQGTLKIEGGREGYARCVYQGCTGFDDNMWQEVAGSVEAVLGLSGAKNVRVRLRTEGTDSNDSCEMEAYWT